MIASLMMYQRPQLEGAHNRYWALIRKFLAEANIQSPQNLSQDAEEFSLWLDPELVLSQTCGMPYRTCLHGKVTLVGTADFGVEQCPPGYYRSALVVRKDDQRENLPAFKGAVFAYNQKTSQSGYAAPYWHLQPHGFWFANQLHTEQHLASAKAVATGRADIAALDAVSWRLMKKYEDFANQLQVLEWTTPTPALPYIAAAGADRQATFNAIQKAIDHLTYTDRQLLGLKGIIYIPPEVYLAVLNPPA